jgi:hypothetical protein
MAGEYWPNGRWSYWNGPPGGAFNYGGPQFGPYQLNLLPAGWGAETNCLPVPPVVESREEEPVPSPPPPSGPEPVRLFASPDEYFEFLEDIVTEVSWDMNSQLPGMVRRAVRKWAEKKFGKYKPEGVGDEAG